MRKYMNCLGLVLSLIAVSSTSSVKAFELIGSYHRSVVMAPSKAPSGPVRCYQCNEDTDKCVIIRCPDE